MTKTDLALGSSLLCEYKKMCCMVVMDFILNGCHHTYSILNKILLPVRVLVHMHNINFVGL
jgi:hypothetical protein